MKVNKQVKKRWLLCLLIFFSKSISAQSLQAGEQLPSLQLDHVLNTPNGKLATDMLRGKLVILDFWSTGCLSCLRSFKGTDSLQVLFDDKIQFVLINPESKDSTEHFFALRNKLHRPSVPMVTGDTLLAQLFPHEGKPYHVWVDSSGIVRYFTNGYNSTEERVKTFIEEGNTNLATTAKKRMENGPVLNTNYEASTLFFSFLSTCMEGRRSGYTAALKGRVLSWSCVSIANLYSSAYDKGGHYFKRPGLLLLEVADKSQYEFPTDKNLLDDWKRKYCYSYEIAIPEKKSDHAYSLMQQDLDRYFGLKSFVEKRSISCMVLERTGSKRLLETKGGEAADNFFQWNPHVSKLDSIRYLHNQPFSTFYMRLQGSIEQLTGMPFLNETGFTGHTDIALSGSVMDDMNIVLLNSELERYGLQVQERKRKVPVLVVTDRF